MSKLPGKIQRAIEDSESNSFMSSPDPTDHWVQVVQADWDILKAHIQAQESKLAERDARVKELEESLADNSELLTIAHMDGYHKGQKSCTDHTTSVKIGEQIIEKEVQKRRADKAEATLARVLEWARGRCECCEHWKWKIFNVDGGDMKSEYCSQRVDRQPCEWLPAWPDGEE